MQIHASELDQLERISVGAAQDRAERPSLIVWPEVPAPFSMQDPAFAQLAQKIARESASDFLVGIVDWKRDAAGKWLASNTRHPAQPARACEFSHMIRFIWCPFGEFVPYRRWLTFAGRLTADIARFHAGHCVQRRASCRMEASAFSSATKRFSRRKCASSRCTARNC